LFTYFFTTKPPKIRVALLFPSFSSKEAIAYVQVKSQIAFLFLAKNIVPLFPSILMAGGSMVTFLPLLS